MANTETLRVRAVPGIFASLPGYPASHGAQAEYIGRRVDQDAIQANAVVRGVGTERVTTLTNLEACYPPDPEHNAKFSVATDGLHVMAAVRRLLRDGDIALNDDVMTAASAIPPQRVPRRAAATPDEADSK